MKGLLDQNASIAGAARPLHQLPVIAVTVLVLLATSACGFKLRGQVEIPPELNPMFIKPASGSRVGRAIVQQLEGSQVRIAERPQDARLILRISNESSSSRVIAVDRNGKALASELHFRLSFDAVSPDGKQLVPRQGIDVVRSFENRDVEVLGKQTESEQIRAEMVRDAANRILSVLRAILV